jgi:mannose-6-phosphate isomerase-like protein (cupin superfamily)
MQDRETYAAPLPGVAYSCSIDHEFQGPSSDRRYPVRLTVADSLQRLPGLAGERFVELFRHGTLSVELYAPRGSDPQQPHRQDEVYVVAEGSGIFVNGPERHAFGKGDVLFVPAGVLHRFEEFSEDLLVWVIFYGPQGGERRA